MDRYMNAPLDREEVKTLRAGDYVYISGTIYTARDAAHKRLVALIEKGEDLPFCLQDQVIYYVGPTPAKPHQVFGSGGPTTAGRMDAYAPVLMKLGLRGMIGKGYRQQAVKEAMQTYHCVYFGAIGGAGAYISRCVESSEVIAFEDLGPEAIRRLVVKDFPLTVIIDSQGNDLYEMGRTQYVKEYKHDNP